MRRKMMKQINQALCVFSVFCASLGVAVPSTKGFSVYNDTTYPITAEVTFQYGPYDRQNQIISIAPGTHKTIRPNTDPHAKPGSIQVHTIQIQLPNGSSRVLSVERNFPYREVVVGACTAYIHVTMQDQDTFGYQVFFACE